MTAAILAILLALGISLGAAPPPCIHITPGEGGAEFECGLGQGNAARTEVYVNGEPVNGG